ncbi:predicted protein [Chaetoceros tenuissimus]|uniref:Uncharacterized protein n=1 Tax=Chaetoceros tenuissimus TaxID=426638 RepID=A0AAD3H706_9STRA|nr:predicted protein [Chaetoceros tenuissimus]
MNTSTKEIELNDCRTTNTSASEEKNSAVVILDEEGNKICHEQQKNLSDMRLSQPQELEEELTKFDENTGNNIIFSQKEDDAGTFSVFILNLFPKAYQQLRSSEEANDDIPTNIEEYNSSVPFLSNKKRSIPNGCEAEGTWGTTKYYGFNTCILCLLLTFAVCGPFGLFVLCCPQDRRSAYLVNGKVYDRYGNLLGEEEDLVFQPTIEGPGRQTISR